MSKNFADLGVSKAVVGALADRGIESPFPVQRLVIEDVLAGRDVLVQSPTGSTPDLETFSRSPSVVHLCRTPCTWLRTGSLSFPREASAWSR